MTLPANDAFTLGLTGSHDPTRPPYSLSFRSTSPKIPFVSGSKSSYSSTHSIRPPRPTRRSMSNGTPNGSLHISSDSNNKRRPHQENTTPHKSSRKIQTSQNTVALKKQPHTVVDWEIPRKTLHSSIGSFLPYLQSSPPSR